MSSSRLSELTPNDWVLIQAKAIRRIYKVGEEIIRQGDWGDSLYIVRRGEASVELAGTGTRSILATLGPNDICGEIAFLERGKSTAAVVAREQEVEADQLNAKELRAIFEAFPGLASRFYLSLAMILAQRLRVTSKELAREMSHRDGRTK